DSDSDTYEVEAVVGRRLLKGKVQYLLKWKGYDERQWTDIEDCQSCTEKIEDFEKSLLKPDTTIRIASPAPEPSTTENEDRAPSEKSTSRKSKRAQSPSIEDSDDDDGKKKGRRSVRLSKPSQSSTSRNGRSRRAQKSPSQEEVNDQGRITPLSRPNKNAQENANGSQRVSSTSSSGGSNQLSPTRSRHARTALSSSEERNDAREGAEDTEDAAHAEFLATYGSALGIPVPGGSPKASSSKRPERGQSPDSDASSIIVVSVGRRPRPTPSSGSKRAKAVTIDSSDSEMEVKPSISRKSNGRKSNGRVGNFELKLKTSPHMKRRSNRWRRDSDNESDSEIVSTPSRKRHNTSMSSIVFGRNAGDESDTPSSQRQLNEVRRPSAKRSKRNEKTPEVVTVEDDDVMELIETRKRRPSIIIPRHGQRSIDDIAEELDQEQLMKSTTSVALLTPVIPPSIKSSGLSPLDQMLTTMIIIDPFVMPVDTSSDKDKKNKKRPEPIERTQDWASLNILRLEDLPGFVVWSAEAYSDEGHLIPEPSLQRNSVERFMDRDVERIVGYVPGGPVPFYIVKLALKEGETSVNVQEVVVGVEQCKLAIRVFPEAVSEYINRCARIRSR
ncbi:hypothetical protein PENTCL1PPCAC_29189, partial [Pristionchus entomophagus]